MNEVNQRVNTTFQVADQATKPLAAIAAAGHRVSHIFDHASSLVGMFGSVAAVAGGAFSAHEVIKGTMDHLANVKRIKDMTGMAAETADGLLETFAKGGVAGDEMAAAVARMGRVAMRAELSTRAMKGNVITTTNAVTKLGINVHRGPEQAFMRMAQLAKQGKLDVISLSYMLRVAPETARKMFQVLKKGPEALRESMVELQHRGLAVTSENLASYVAIKKAQNAIHATWERITIVIGTKLLPVIERLLSGVEKKLEGWLEYAQEFGTMLGDFLRDHLHTVMQISKVLLANFALMKATGLGMIPWAGKLGGGFMGRVTAPAAVAKDTAMVTALASAPGRLLRGLRNEVLAITEQVRARRAGLAVLSAEGPILQSRMLGFFQRAGRGAAAAPGALLGVFTTIGTTLRHPIQALARVAPTLLRFALTALRFVGAAAVLGAIIGGIVYAVQLVRENVDGIRTFLADWWETIRARVAVLVDLLEPITRMFSTSGPVGQFFHKVVFGTIMLLTDAVDGMFKVLQAIVIFIDGLINHFTLVAKQPIRAFELALEQADRMTREKIRQRGVEKVEEEIRRRKATQERPEREAAPVYDFRGSRFDITQKFAEGFDPDRIAVAFTQDIAALGERKLQSGWSPLFAVR